MSDQIQLEHFSNLISIALADGIVKESERIALSKIAFDNGIHFDKMNDMLASSEEFTYIIPQNEKDRNKQLTDMIKLSMIDGELAKAELELILSVGSKLHFTPDEIKAKIKNHLDELY
ncbi:MAG: TerB family tellurite resistance protein [Cyclobacteriaceae bacterium]|nr:TerB family tellurite resistance protein [Cyclobacteriaceae bacterium]